MEEIKVGEYVRTKRGSIGKFKFYGIDDGAEEIVYFKNHKGTTCVDENEITKHSFNIIDLIEVGDYVNGDRIVEIEKDYYNLKLDKMVTLETANLIIGNEEGMLSISANEIKTILTKEQYEANCYEVK